MALQHVIRHSAIMPSSRCHQFAQLTTKPVLQHVSSVHLACYHQLSKYFFNKKTHLSCCFHNGYRKQSKFHQANLTTVGHAAPTEKSYLNILPREAPKHLSLSPMKNSLLINTFSTSSFKGAGEDIGNKESGTTDNEYVDAFSVEDIIAVGLLSFLIVYTWTNRRSARDNLITDVATGGKEIKRLMELSKIAYSPPDSAEIILSEQVVSSQSHEFVHCNVEDTLISTMTSNSGKDMIVKVELTSFIEESESGSLPVIEESESGFLPLIEESESGSLSVIEESESGSLPDPAETNFSKAVESCQSDGDHESSAHCYIPSEEVPRKVHHKPHKEKAQKTMDTTKGRVGRERHPSSYLNALKKINGTSL